MTPLDNLVREAQVGYLKKCSDFGTAAMWGVNDFLSGFLNQAHALGEASGRENAIEDVIHELNKLSGLDIALTGSKRKDYRDTLRLVCKKVRALEVARTTPHEEGKV